MAKTAKKKNENEGVQRIVVIEPRLLRRSEAATYLALSCAQIDQLRARGHITPVRVPSDRSPDGAVRVPLFDRRELDRAIQRWKGDGR